MTKRLAGPVVVSVVAGTCILALAVVSKYFLDQELDFVSQYGPAWIYIAYVTCRRQGKGRDSGDLFWSLSIALATAAIILVYAL